MCTLFVIVMPFANKVITSVDVIIASQKPRQSIAHKLNRWAALLKIFSIQLR